MSTSSPYAPFVQAIKNTYEKARAYPLAGGPSLRRARPNATAPRVLIFSPHPDDEVVIGGLALRLMRESGWRVVNVAVTLGSKRERQLERLEELRGCCEYIGFELLTPAPRGLEGIRPAARTAHPDQWRDAVDRVASILRDQRPQVVLFPHERDWNSTHEGVHSLIHDALKQQPPEFACFTVETEFWGAMNNPNLMVEITAEQLADLIAALTFHVGEIRRNPYHLTLPAWMIDNVRRGAELVGGQGGASPDFLFATLYRVRRWTSSAWDPTWTGGQTLRATTPAAALFPIP